QCRRKFITSTGVTPVTIFDDLRARDTYSKKYQVVADVLKSAEAAYNATRQAVAAIARDPDLKDAAKQRKTRGVAAKIAQDVAKAHRQVPLALKRNNAGRVAAINAAVGMRGSDAAQAAWDIAIWSRLAAMETGSVVGLAAQNVDVLRILWTAPLPLPNVPVSAI